MRIPFIDRIPFVGPALNDVLDGSTVLGQVGSTPLEPAGVETKVAASTAAASVATLVLTLLGPLLGRLPAPVRLLVTTLLPPLVTAVAGYVAPHTSRRALPVGGGSTTGGVTVG